jgi:hypothetical protein
MLMKVMDREALTPLVQRALGGGQTEITHWQREPVAFTAVNPLSGGVFRYRGTAVTGERVRPWSLIHKVIRLPSDVGSAAPLGLASSGFEDEASYTSPA